MAASSGSEYMAEAMMRVSVPPYKEITKRLRGKNVRRLTERVGLFQNGFMRCALYAAACERRIAYAPLVLLALSLSYPRALPAQRGRRSHLETR